MPLALRTCLGPMIARSFIRSCFKDRFFGGGLRCGNGGLGLNDVVGDSGEIVLDSREKRLMSSQPRLAGKSGGETGDVRHVDCVGLCALKLGFMDVMDKRWSWVGDTLYGWTNPCVSLVGSGCDSMAT